MHTVGKRYTIEIIDGSGARTKSGGWLVTRVDGPLIEIERNGETKIVNTHSPAFVGTCLSVEASEEMPIFVLPDWLVHEGEAIAS